MSAPHHCPLLALARIATLPAAALVLGLCLAEPLAASEPPDGTVLTATVHSVSPDDVDLARGAAVQADGRTLLVGSTVTGARTSLVVMRLYPGGGLDGSFGSGGLVVDPFGSLPDSYAGKAVAVQSDGRIVVAGDIFHAGGDDDMFVARLLASGAPDTSFGSGGITGIPFDLGGDRADEAFALALGPSGTIVVAGTATWSATDLDFAIARLDSSGALDTSFDGDGKKIVAFDLGATDRFDVARAVTELGGGRIAVAGWAHDSDGHGDQFAVVRLLADATLDSTFGGDGRITFGWDLGGSNDDSAHALVAQPDGRLLIAGTALGANYESVFALARLTGSGALDDTFGSNGTGFVLGTYCDSGCAALHDEGTGLALQADGKILVAGAATAGPAGAEAGVARLTRSGSFDATWGRDGIATVGGLSSFGGLYNVRLVLGPDGRPRLGATVWDGTTSFTTDFAYARFSNSYIFGDGFESGNVDRW
jgi:uncharacterized delta-60 repeat protein